MQQIFNMYDYFQSKNKKEYDVAKFEKILMNSFIEK
jgi:hypothetical protein